MVKDIKSEFVIASMNFGEFPKAGIYDWKFVKLSNDGKIKGVYQIFSLDDSAAYKSKFNLEGLGKIDK